MFDKLLSTRLKDSSLNFGLFVLRVSAGALMIPHGYGKFLNYAEKKDKFMDFIGLEGPVTLALVIFAEFFCSILLVTGALTRLALIPLITVMTVVVFQAHNAEIFGDGETAFLFLTMYITLFFSGPGKYSLDKMVLKK